MCFAPYNNVELIEMMTLHSLVINYYMPRDKKTMNNCFLLFFRLVAPLAGAWIEMIGNLTSLTEAEVAPLAGAWIEIS